MIFKIFRMKNTFILFLSFALLSAIGCKKEEIKPYGACPTPAQVEWQKMEMNMMVHFGPNTFSGKEWGDGKEHNDIFNPTGLDCEQWTEIARTAGLKGIVITGKHHDGFCIWPNPVSRHTVAQSKWRDGKGDVLKELSNACKKSGVKFGIYISPWDRYDPAYFTEQYNEVFVKTLEHALSNYGEMFEQWFDGAIGEDPLGRVQKYDWKSFNGTVQRLQPNAIIFSNIGPGCRWVGNENGEAGRTNYCTIDIDNFTQSNAPPQTTLMEGTENGSQWIPAETDVSIRPGWFWRESENNKVKSLQELLKIYYNSVGRNSLLLLNVPPDTRGRIHKNDSTVLMQFGQAISRIFESNLAKNAKVTASNTRGLRFKAENVLDSNYDTYWAPKDSIKTATLTFEFPKEVVFNRILLQEYIPLGQRVNAFTVDALNDKGEWEEIADESTIGYKRIVLTEKIKTSALKLNIKDANACPVINNFGLYLDEIYNDTSNHNKGKYGVVSFSANYMYERPSYTSQIVNQALMGTVVKLGRKDKYWRKITSPEPYSGWVNEMGIVKMTDEELDNYLASPKYICTAEYSKIYSRPDKAGYIISEMVQGDIVRVLMRGKRTVGTKGWTGILLPNGKKGYVDTKDLQLISKKSDKEEVSGKSIIEVAKQYLGTPYFWGGKSIKGVDCSGLVYNAWFMNGMLLPRDASQQALLGVPVKIYDRRGKLNIKNLKTGDLIFFGKKFPDTITHVGIYIGKGKFIHSSQVVRINSLLEYDNDYYEREPLMARRLLGNNKGVIRLEESPYYFKQEKN